MPTKGQVQKQLEKEPTVVHPVFTGSRKASQGCASWSAVQNITGGELHRPSPHPLAAGTRLLHCAFRLCFACKPAGQGWPSWTESVLHYPSANHPVCEQWAQRHLSWFCAGQVTGCIGLECWASAALLLLEPAGTNPQAASPPCFRFVPCPNRAAVASCRWWEARWGPAAALSSFAAVGFPAAAIPAHRGATIAADLITARLQYREARLRAQTLTSFVLGHWNAGCTLEGASCSVPIQSRVRLPLGGEAELPSGLVSHLLLLKNAL